MGKSFQFPLQKVLGYRKARENSESSKLSLSKKKLVDEKDKLNQIEEDKGKALNDNTKKKSVSIQHLKVSSDYIVQLNNNLEEQGEVLKNTEGIVEGDRKKLLEATRNKKAVEILRDKQKTMFDRAMKKREMKLNDEKVSISVHYDKKE